VKVCELCREQRDGKNLALHFALHRQLPAARGDHGAARKGEWQKQGHKLPYNSNDMAARVLTRFRGTVEGVGKFILVKFR
jgi:hypothetical protein